MIEFVKDRQIYEKVVLNALPRAKRFLWVATADIKDMYVDGGGKSMVPLLEVLSGLVSRHVEVRLLHAKEPGKAFRKDFDRYPNLIGGMERILCPRVHFKSVIVDGEFGYMGSANLTGAGMGAKKQERRNFENGVVTDNKKMIGDMMEQFDSVWRGEHCRSCERTQYCADHSDMVRGRV